MNHINPKDQSPSTKEHHFPYYGWLVTVNNPNQDLIFKQHLLDLISTLRIHDSFETTASYFGCLSSDLELLSTLTHA